MVEALVALALMALVVLTLTRLMAVVRTYLHEAQSSLVTYQDLLRRAALSPRCQERARRLNGRIEPGPPPAVWVRWRDSLLPLRCE